jgi:predicted DNA-binding transcriptional regulator YafY
LAFWGGIILPFVKKWLPDIKILEPQELKNRFLDDVKNV